VTGFWGDTILGGHVNSSRPIHLRGEKRDIEVSISTDWGGTREQARPGSMITEQSEVFKKRGRPKGGV